MTLHLHVLGLGHTHHVLQAQPSQAPMHIPVAETKSGLPDNTSFLAHLEVFFGPKAHCLS